MANPYDKVAANKLVKHPTDISGLAQAISDAMGNNVRGLANTGGGNYNGGGGGSVAAPVSTLASLPQTPVIQDLIAKGLLREGMPPEQIQAIIAIQGMAGSNPIDIAALKKMVSDQYESTTGDILDAGQNWMQQLYGTVTDPNDPNAALFANDPLFSSYAGGMAQMDETADSNEATDLAWFDKQQQAMADYYNSLMASVATAAPVSSGGGGGGGGGGYHGGGGGGSGSEGNNWTDPKTQITATNKTGVTATDNISWNYPDWYNSMIELAQQSAGDEGAQFAATILDRNLTPIATQGALQDSLDDATGQLAGYNYRELSNQMWQGAAPTSFSGLSDNYLRNQGLVLGDDPEDDLGVTWAHQDPNYDPSQQPLVAMTPEAQARQDQIAGLVNTAFNPESAFPGWGEGGANSLASVGNILNYAQQNPGGFMEYLRQHAPAGTPDPIANKTNTVPGMTPYEMPGLVPSGSIANSSQSGTTVLTPNSVENGSYVPNIQTPAPPDVYQSDLGRPLAELLSTQYANQYAASGNNTLQAAQAPSGGLADIPPGIFQAAIQSSGESPPSIAALNHELLRSGLPVLDSQGNLTGPLPRAGQPLPALGTDDLDNVFAQGPPPGDMMSSTDVGNWLGHDNSYSKGGFSKAPVGQTPQAAPVDPAQLAQLAQAFNPQNLAAMYNAAIGKYLEEATIDPVMTGTSLTAGYQDQAITDEGLRPDILKAYQTFSQQQDLPAERAASNMGVDYTPDLGQFFQAQTLTPDDINDLTLQEQLLPILMAKNRLLNTNINAAPYQQKLVTTGANTAQAQTTSHTYDPELSAQLTGVGDPDWYSGDQIADQIANGFQGDEQLLPDDLSLGMPANTGGRGRSRSLPSSNKGSAQKAVVGAAKKRTQAKIDAGKKTLGQKIYKKS